jgi:DNA-binding transcriptional LysR family regulator
VGIGNPDMTSRTGGRSIGGRRVHEVAVGALEGAHDGRIELRQLRYFVAVAEELHFGRAAAREHIAQSALSQQVQRLERTLGVLLVRRTTRHVELTAAGARFLIEVRQILGHLNEAVGVARGLATSAPFLRIGVLDEGYEAARPILRELQGRHPELEIHQVQAGVPEQLRLLADGRLDAGVGRAAETSPIIASELFRLDPLGVLVPHSHRFGRLAGVPLSALDGETLVLADERRSPEFNQFVAEVCRSAGFFPTLYHGSVQNLQAGVDVVTQDLGLLCVPASAAARATNEVDWRPLVPAVPRYPWSILWHAQTASPYVRTLVSIARELSRENGWREAAAKGIDIAS